MNSQKSGRIIRDLGSAAEIKGCVFAFACLLLVMGTSVRAETANEWTFERDPSGTSLSQALNSGASSPLAQFPSGSERIVFTTNRTLLCIGEDPAGDGAWTQGAMLNAPLPQATSGKHYLRYDLDYDFSSPSNVGGNALGVYFSDGSGDKIAGLVLGYDPGDQESTIPASRTLTEVAFDNALEGTLIAIAEVDLDNDTLKVWFDLNDNVVFAENSPATTVSNMAMDSINNLTFHATGDFRPAGSMDFAAIDNIRQASSWTEIVRAPIDETAPPELEVTVVPPSGMGEGDVNPVTFIISNSGGPASNVTSTLIYDGAPAAFTMVSNNPPALLEARTSLTNTYWLTANTSGQYVFEAQAFSAETNSPVTNFNITVGLQVSYVTNSIVEISGGLVPGKYEPGETIDITVSSINDGARGLSNIVNNLSLGLTQFSDPVPVSDMYASLAVGAITSTTYRITINEDTPAGIYEFGITNQAGSRVWALTNAFSVEVYSETVPSVSPLSIVLRAPEGGSDTETVTVRNDGNIPLNFSVRDDAFWGIRYTEELDDINFSTSARTAITLNEGAFGSADMSDAIPLGFDFSFYGTEYSYFYVTSGGTIGLSLSDDTTDLGNIFGPLPSASGLPLIAPLWSESLTTPNGTVFYTVESTRVVISYTASSIIGGGSDLEFQAILYKNGQIEFRYNEINGSLSYVTTGIQGDENNYLNRVALPATGDSILFTPQGTPAWVTYSPSEGTVAPMSTQTVTFTMNAAGQSLVSQNSFTAYVDFGVDGSENVSVDAAVVAAVPIYSAPDNLMFDGPAGEITTAPFVMTNSGTGTLDFWITDSSVSETRFAVTNVGYLWINISSIGTEVELIDPSPNFFVTAKDEGTSGWLPIEFDFPFVGNSYNRFAASANGALRLDTTGRVFAVRTMSDPLLPDQLIVPYGGDLVFDENATLKMHATSERLVVTWENVKQYGLNGGSNLTFQVVLYPNGTIACQYKRLEGHQWPQAVCAGWRDVIAGVVRLGEGNIIQPSDWTTFTNEISGYVYTQYVNSVSERILALEPYETRIISYTPTHGSIPAGGTAEITIIGDASSQLEGSNAASASSTLTINHNQPGSSTLAVTFTATNSQETSFVPLATPDDSDGDGMADDDERTAGSDPQDAGSVFSPGVTQTSSGPVLSWDESVDGQPRTYNIFWTTNLIGIWGHLATVTNGTSYLDVVHINEPAIYYKMTVE